jgi:hypothetical protein
LRCPQRTPLEMRGVTSSTVHIFADVDLSLAKTFSLSRRHELWKLQFKADAFDLANHPNYGLPHSSLGSGLSYGAISSSYPSRTMQLHAIPRF